MTILLSIISGTLGYLQGTRTVSVVLAPDFSKLMITSEASVTAAPTQAAKPAIKIEAPVTHIATQAAKPAVTLKASVTPVATQAAKPAVPQVLPKLPVIPRVPVPVKPRPAIENRTISIEAEKYTVSVFYPRTGISSIDAKIEIMINAEVDDFVAFQKMKKVPDRWKSEFFIRYNGSRLSDNMISFRFDIYAFTGGAHGMTRVVTRNFDTRTGMEYKLAGIFKKDSNYPVRISSIVVPILKKSLGWRADEKWIKEGAGPVAKNFERFVFNGSDIVFIFEQYQVAPYSEGIREAKVPLKDLKDILDPAISAEIKI